MSKESKESRERKGGERKRWKIVVKTKMGKKYVSYE